MSGITEINLGGKIVTLRFNNWQKEALGKLYGTDPLEAGRKMQERLEESILLVSCDLIYTGMVGNYRVQLKDIDFTIDQIVEWVADADNADIARVFNEWLGSSGQRNLLPGADAGKKKQPSQTQPTKRKSPGKK